MAQLIVERSSIVAAILPAPDHEVPGALSTQNALMVIFCSYLQKVSPIFVLSVFRTYKGSTRIVEHRFQ